MAATSQLPLNNFDTQAGMLIPLKAGVTYQASKLPLALRVTPSRCELVGGAVEVIGAR
jgi:hypothetical protein